jgi:hypothetical protein
LVAVELYRERVLRLIGKLQTFLVITPADKHQLKLALDQSSSVSMVITLGYLSTNTSRSWHSTYHRRKDKDNVQLRNREYEKKLQCPDDTFCPFSILQVINIWIREIPVSDWRKVQHQNPRSHRLNVVCNSIQHHPNKTEECRFRRKLVVHEDQTDRQLNNDRSKTAIKLKLGGTRNANNTNRSTIINKTTSLSIIY